MRKIFVSGIGTEIGKTITSAVLTETFFADYWKPIQSGGLQYTDTDRVKSLVTNLKSRFHPETYKLTQPLSPHASAALDNIEISLDSLQIPETNNTLVIEGAGGLMVPLNQNRLIIDLIKHLECEVVLVSKNYLGSINHTLLSCAVLRMYQIPVLGIIFNGHENQSSEGYIAHYTGIPVLGRIEHADVIDKPFIKRHAEMIRKRLQQLKLL